MGDRHFTDVMLHSSISYHQQHALPAATEQRQLHKIDHTTCRNVIHFHGFSNLQEVLICGQNF